MRANAGLLPVTQVLFIATRLLLVLVHCKCVLQGTKHNYGYMFIQVYDLLQFSYHQTATEKAKLLKENSV